MPCIYFIGRRIMSSISNEFFVLWRLQGALMIHPTSLEFDDHGTITPKLHAMVAKLR
jgi:hypothetical protein